MIQRDAAQDRGACRGLKFGITARITVARHDGYLSGAITIPASTLLMVNG